MWDYIRSSHQSKKTLFFIPEVLYIALKRYCENSRYDITFLQIQ
jgi:hypothetical protein